MKTKHRTTNIDVAVEIYREPHFAGNASKNVLRADEKSALQVFPETAIDLAELFKR